MDQQQTNNENDVKGILDVLSGDKSAKFDVAMDTQSIIFMTIGIFFALFISMLLAGMILNAMK